MNNTLTQRPASSPELCKISRTPAQIKTLAIFGRFQVIWGQKWAKQIENIDLYEAAIQEWSGIIAKLEDNAIRRAIEMCKMKHDFPPSISEFVKSALEIPHYYEIYSATYANSPFVDKYKLYTKTMRRDWNEREREEYCKSIYYQLLDEFLNEFIM